MRRSSYYEHYCWLYAIELAKKLGVNSIYGWTNDKTNDINKISHAVVSYKGNLYDASGKTNITKIRKFFGNGRLVRFSLNHKELAIFQSTKFKKHKLIKDASTLVSSEYEKIKR